MVKKDGRVRLNRSVHRPSFNYPQYDHRSYIIDRRSISYPKGIYHSHRLYHCEAITAAGVLAAVYRFDASLSVLLGRWFVSSDRRARRIRQGCAGQRRNVYRTRIVQLAVGHRAQVIISNQYSHPRGAFPQQNGVHAPYYRNIRFQ